MAGATFTLTKDYDSLANLELTPTVDVMREIGLLLRERVIRRTLSGVDASGQAFAPYSKRYEDAKRKAIGGAGVNLQVSGNMLNQITIVDASSTPEQASVTLGWDF